MGKDLCIIHGNCQGDALNILLNQSERFRRRFETLRVVNYLDEKIDPKDLARCSLFLYQYLGAKWGDSSTDRLLSSLPAGCESICFPNMFFNGYWPFWFHAPSVIEFPDKLLEELLERELPIPALLNIYYKCSPDLTGDFDAIAARSLAQEKEKEKFTLIKYVHLIEESWRQKQMFITINHPSMPLLVHAASSVLKLLGLGALPDSLSDSMPHPYDEFWLPIHPCAGKRLGLSFAGPERKYNCYAQKLAHAEYTRFYLACRMNNIVNLSAALAQARIENAKKVS